MGDVSHSGAKKKKPGGGQNKSYYYSLTYDEDDTGSLDYAPAADDELQKRVASILAETEIDDQHQVPALDDGRLDMNDNLFGEADDSRRNSRTLDFELSDDGGGEGDEGEEEFQSVDSKSDTFRPEAEVETTSVDDDFVRITRPYGSGDARRQPPCQTDAGAASTGNADDDVFVVSGAMMTSTSSSERSPTAATSGPVRHTGSGPLSVVYVKQQKPSTELYDGNFIDDDILEPQDERALDDNISQDLLPMPIEEMTLEMDEDDDDDGIPDTASGVDADPIIFRKSAQRWYVRHRRLVIGAALVGSLLAAGGLAAVIYFAVAAFS